MKVKNNLTARQMRLIARHVFTAGLRRQRVQGKKFVDVDFAMGAAAVFEALGKSSHIPAIWIMAPLSGQPIFKEEEK